MLSVLSLRFGEKLSPDTDVLLRYNTSWLRLVSWNYPKNNSKKLTLSISQASSLQAQHVEPVENGLLRIYSANDVARTLIEWRAAHEAAFECGWLQLFVEQRVLVRFADKVGFC